MLPSAAILTVSDTAHADPSTDQTTSALKRLLVESEPTAWTVFTTKIVPDSYEDIQSTILEWCKPQTDKGPGSDGRDRLNLILVTGGTGFAVRDVTPEAVRGVLQRDAPGLVHAMLAKGLEITPFAMMARPVAGIRNGTIIVTLPGSPKGAKENLESILKLLPHACMQAAGMDSRALHAGGVKKLEEEAGVTASKSRPKESHQSGHHSHDHSHDHAHGHAIPQPRTRPEDRPQTNDPSKGPSRRYRESPYPMLSVGEALSVIERNTPPPKALLADVGLPVLGCILAADVEASEAVPAFRASIVDGYVVVTAPNAPSLKGVYPVASVSHATPGKIPPLRPGDAARITTGAPLPPGANAVVMVEDTVLKSMTEDGTEEAEVEILADTIRPGENVREEGSDIAIGETVLMAGDKITPGELGVLATIGRRNAMVYEKPVVGVMSTGDEIVDWDTPADLRTGQVRDCNRTTLMAALQSWGFEAVDLGIARDTPGELEERLRAAMRRASTIITTGGASMGELDLLKPTLERRLGGAVHFGRVSMKPGKPTTFATVPFKGADGAPATCRVFSLPGNPASAIVTAALFVLPSLMKMAGEPGVGLPRVVVALDEEVRCDKVREEYQRAVVRSAEDGTLRAVVTGGQRSSRVASFRGANALLVLPAGGGVLGKGTKVKALLMSSPL